MLSDSSQISFQPLFVKTPLSILQRVSDFASFFAVFAIANISGGHVTPTVTIATMITGHIDLLKGLLYMLAQLLGAIFASLIMVSIDKVKALCLHRFGMLGTSFLEPVSVS